MTVVLRWLPTSFRYEMAYVSSSDERRDRTAVLSMQCMTYRSILRMRVLRYERSIYLTRVISTVNIVRRSSVSFDDSEF